MIPLKYILRICTGGYKFILLPEMIYLQMDMDGFFFFYQR